MLQGASIVRREKGNDWAKGVMTDGSFTAGSEKGSQKTEKQEEVVRAVVREKMGSVPFLSMF